MTSRPRLVATDLDGTIVRADNTISDRTVAALQAVEAAGIPLVLVTGRPPRWMADVSERLGHTGIAVCANGAILYDLHREEVVETFPLSVEVGRDVARRLREALPDAGFAVETVEGFAHDENYRPRWWSEVPSEVRRATNLDDLWSDVESGATKLLLRHESLEADELLAAARDVVGDVAELTHSSLGGLVEISAAGVSKATTLARVAAEHGVDAADVLAFGDMPNDLPMLRWAGTSYAVANAHPDVKAAVDRHTASVEDDGVAQVLERHLA